MANNFQKALKRFDPFTTRSRIPSTKSRVEIIFESFAFGPNFSTPTWPFKIKVGSQTITREVQ